MHLNHQELFFPYSPNAAQLSSAFSKQQAFYSTQICFRVTWTRKAYFGRRGSSANEVVHLDHCPYISCWCQCA